MKNHALSALALAMFGLFALGSGGKSKDESKTTTTSATGTLSTSTAAGTTTNQATATVADGQPKAACDMSERGSCREIMSWGFGGEAGEKQRCENGLMTGKWLAAQGCPTTSTILGYCELRNGAERQYYYKAGTNASATGGTAKDACEGALMGKWNAKSGTAAAAGTAAPAGDAAKKKPAKK